MSISKSDLGELAVVASSPKKEALRGVRGMNDILPADEVLWQRFDEAVADVMAAYAYRRIRTPIVEHTRLFVRGIGEVTDIVEKEMYSFKDALNGEHLSLRPENTAGAVRAVIEHNLLYDGPKRLWYTGPMFRHERPQKGRYRQFHQVGAEAMGFAGPDVDAELILLCQRLWDDLNLPVVSLEINSLGQSEERAAHRGALISYFSAHENQLDEEAKRRLHSNPLRILDTKNPAMQELAEGAPKLIDFLGAESLAHFEGLQSILKSQNIPFKINPRLVRGLDYYNLSVFEWICKGLTVCGGGRYDPLIEMLGGKPAPGVGFAIGVERILELMRSQVMAQPSVDVYVVHQGEAAASAALQCAERLRDSAISVQMHAGGGGFKAQMKRADGSGAAYAIILGDNEIAEGKATVKALRAAGAATGEGSDKLDQQWSVALEQVAESVRDKMLGR